MFAQEVTEKRQEISIKTLFPLFTPVKMHRAWMILLLLAVPALAAAALTVATYNVENYTIADRMVEGVYRPAYPKPQKEKAALCHVVADIAPDILALCEMGKPEYLAEFQRELKQAGQDFPHAVVLEAADADRHVAVLAKVPFKEVRRHAAVPIKYFGEPDVVKRGVLEVIFATSEGDVSLFVIHLKSKFTERKDDPEGATRRALEAEAVRDLVLARYPDPAKAKFIIAGDWNDTRATRPVRALQKRGETLIGEIIEATDSRGQTWTQYYRKEDVYSRFDYLLVSPGLKPLVAGGRATVWDGAGTSEASDHRPVFMTLQLARSK
jgi:endonuclease/exonuclease/phosphatase family metal-dependent hydrolase